VSYRTTEDLGTHEKRRLHGDRDISIEVYKIMTGKEKLIQQNFFQPSPTVNLLRSLEDII